MTTTTKTLDTGSDDLIAELVGAGSEIALLTLNRPARRNALSAAMLESLARMVERCEVDTSIRAVVLTGSGSAFCAGGDVKAMAESDGAGGAESSFEARVARQLRSQRATVARLYHLPKPVIAALPGAAAGAGMGLCMACDMRIAADSALMTTAFARVGLSGDYGLPWLLTQQVGRSKALELMYCSDKLSAAQCLSLGLVNQVVPDGELRDSALALAARLARGPSVAYRHIKQNVNGALAGDLGRFMEGEVSRHLTCANTEDHREAARAFVERREPQFKGC